MFFLSFFRGSHLIHDRHNRNGFFFSRSLLFSKIENLLRVITCILVLLHAFLGAERGSHGTFEIIRMLQARFSFFY